tara:strand:+ start:1885 stop:2505 length:621 start_codon:yes stop_codon:yes gene_type:complete
MLIVLENFLDVESDLYKEVTADSFWTQDNIPRNTWLDKNESAKNAWSALCHKIWRHTNGVLPREFEGFEYWANEISENNDLGWHQDKDEFKYHFADPQENVPPYLGAIYYAHTEKPDGGYLEIRRVDEHPYEVGEHPDFVSEDPDQYERIQPVPNRLVIFDSRLWHRVSWVHSGKRRYLATNVWIDKPMEENFHPDGFDLSKYEDA